jgi:hypothetical protein
MEDLMKVEGTEEEGPVPCVRCDDDDGFVVIISATDRG